MNSVLLHFANINEDQINSHFQTQSKTCWDRPLLYVKNWRSLQTTKKTL